MSGIGEAVGAFGTLKSAYELVQELRKSNDPKTLKAGIEQLSDRLLSARAEGFKALEDYKVAVDRADAAEAKLRAAVTFDEQAKNYVRHRCYPGVFVYREKTPAAGEAAPPNYCAHCFGEKKLEILQVTGSIALANKEHTCPRCKSKALFQVSP